MFELYKGKQVCHVCSTEVQPDPGDIGDDWPLTVCNGCLGWGHRLQLQTETEDDSSQ